MNVSLKMPTTLPLAGVVRSFSCLVGMSCETGNCKYSCWASGKQECKGFILREKKSYLF